MLAVPFVVNVAFGFSQTNVPSVVEAPPDSAAVESKAPFKTVADGAVAVGVAFPITKAPLCNCR